MHLMTEILYDRHRQTLTLGTQPRFNAPHRRVRLTIPKPTREHGLTDQVQTTFAKLASMSGILALRRSYGGRVSGRHDRDDAKRNEIRPARHPLIKQRPVIALHYLIAPCQILCDPARHIAKAVGLLAPGLAEAAVDWSSITVTKIFDDHVEHRQVSRMLWEQNFAISMAAWQVVRT